MKVLHISRTMGQGGAEKVVYQLCKDCKGVIPIVASTGGQYVEELNKLNIKHYIIPDIDKKNPFTMFKILLILFVIVFKEKVDIIHTHHRMAACYSRIICFFIRKKRIYTAHNVFYNKKILMKFSLKGSYIVAVGDGVKSNLIEFYNVNNKNVSVIYNSVQSCDFGELDKSVKEILTKDKIKIGTIGRLTEQKGIDVFIKAMSLSIKKNDNLIGVIVGDGEDKDELKKLVDVLDLQDKIYFLGYQRNVLKIIGYFDFLVLSSRWEGYPLTPIEVFSKRKTIIASDISGNNEVVIDESNGLLFEKDNVEQLSYKINELLNNNPLKNKLEKKAYEDYNSKFSYECFILNYSNLYESIH